MLALIVPTIQALTNRIARRRAVTCIAFLLAAPTAANGQAPLVSFPSAASLQSASSGAPGTFVSRLQKPASQLDRQSLSLDDSVAHHTRRRNMLVWGSIGFVAGAAFGYANGSSHHSSCGGEVSCTEGRPYMTALGGIIGALLGVAIGAFSPHS